MTKQASTWVSRMCGYVGCGVAKYGATWLGKVWRGYVGCGVARWGAACQSRVRSG